jgi:hypothetical protein
MHVVSDFLKRWIAPLQRRACLCCSFNGPNDIGRIQRGPGTDLSWEELELLVKGITGESFVPESLILSQGIHALCDDLGLRMAILATLPTLDESGVAVRQTGGRDPHRGIRISDAPAGGPQPAGTAPLCRSCRGPQPLGQGQRGCKQRLRPRWHRGVEGREATPAASRRRVVCFRPPRSVRGLLAGPRRSAPRPRARRGASVRCHHHHRVRRRHHHHHHRSRRHHHHLGVISPRGTTTSSNNSSSSSNNNRSSSNSSGRPASRVAGKSRAPSKCGPFSMSLSCRQVLTHCLFARASSSTTPKATPPPPGTRPTNGSGSQQQESAGSGADGPPPAAAQTAPAASQAPAGGPAVAASASGGVAAIEEVPAGGSAPASDIAPTPDAGGNTGGASSSNPPPTPEETEVVFGWRLWSGAEPEAAPVPLSRVLSRAHQALHETEAAILRECEALEAEHQRLSD